MKTMVDLLILGAGWTSTFLTGLCDERKLTYGATSRSGRDSTTIFTFDPDSDDPEPYYVLPNARTVLITFPIDKKGASERLVRLYTQSRGQEDGGLGGDAKTQFIQLGTTSIWDGARLRRDSPVQPVQHKWYDRHSAFIPTARAEAEEELLSLLHTFPTTVLNLSGLWGGPRSPRNWVRKVVPSKEALKDKGSLHMIHGIDVARCILAVHENFEKAQGQRWLLSDGRVYDWWDLASAWGSTPAGIIGEEQRLQMMASPSEILDIASPSPSVEADRGPQAMWVRELMEESGLRALPRPVELLGRALDSREFWATFELSPLRARMDDSD